MNLFSGETFVKTTIFEHLLINFIAIVSDVMCNHEFCQGIA